MLRSRGHPLKLPTTAAHPLFSLCWFGGAEGPTTAGRGGSSGPESTLFISPQEGPSVRWGQTWGGFGCSRERPLTAYLPPEAHVPGQLKQVGLDSRSPWLPGLCLETWAGQRPQDPKAVVPLEWSGAGSAQLPGPPRTLQEGWGGAYSHSRQPWGGLASRPWVPHGWGWRCGLGKDRAWPSQDGAFVPKCWRSCSRKTKVSTVCGMRRTAAGKRPL